MLAIICSILVIIAGIAISVVLTERKLELWKDWDKNKVSYESNPRYNTDPKYMKAMIGEEPDKSKVTYPIFISLALAAIFIFSSCIAILPTGYTGVLTTFGKVENKNINSGINFIAPWQKVVKMDNRAQKVQIQMSAFSSDIQQVDLLLSVNYCINQSTANELYRTVGTKYYDNIMYPRIRRIQRQYFRSILPKI